MLQVSVGQIPPVAVALEPIIQKRLIQIRRDDFFAKLVGFGADERQPQPREHGN